VFDAKKRLEKALVMGRPLSCVSYMNDQGDLLCGMGEEVVVIRAGTYAAEVIEENQAAAAAAVEAWGDAVAAAGKRGRV
jgi:hypothetical protein